MKFSARSLLHDRPLVPDGHGRLDRAHLRLELEVASWQAAQLPGSPSAVTPSGSPILSAAASGGSTPPRTWRKLSCARSPSRRLVAFGKGAVWATNEIADEVYRIDPRTNRARVVSGMTAPRVVAVGEAVWVTVADLPSVDAALPDSVCSGILSGEAGPRLMLVSDLPPGFRSHHHLTDGGRDPIALEQHGFKAGPTGSSTSPAIPRPPRRDDPTSTGAP